MCSVFLFILTEIDFTLEVFYTGGIYFSTYINSQCCASTTELATDHLTTIQQYQQILKPSPH